MRGPARSRGAAASARKLPRIAIACVGETDQLQIMISLLA